MTNNDLSSSYINKSNKRIKILKVLFEDEAYSDVVFEAQEIVELVQKVFLL